MDPEECIVFQTNGKAEKNSPNEVESSGIVRTMGSFQLHG